VGVGAEERLAGDRANDLRFSSGQFRNPARRQGTEREDERKHAGNDTVAECKTPGFDDFEIFSLSANE